ncbi:MAG: hypothetical protein H0U58_05355 [Chloroflexi bacterium]|nr:hypothetical protein [Chloroflexota bacterium]
MEMTEFAGWPNCVRLSNPSIDLVATTDVGPRIIRIGFVGEQNLFTVFEDSAGQTGGDEWHSYGGHRLWQAPEAWPATYTPENDPIAHTWDGTSLTLNTLDRVNAVEKSMRLTLAASEPSVEVVHRLVNRAHEAVELAPWALSVMAPGGRAVFPQEDYRPHPEWLDPARPIVLWRFTDMSDPRWTWGRRYIQLRQDPNATTKQKAGFLNTKGWAAYLLGGDVFIKRFDHEAGASYPDFGCNTETYADAAMLEVETLGPLVRLLPGEHVDHVERWSLHKATIGEDETEIDEKLLPVIPPAG